VKLSVAKLGVIPATTPVTDWVAVATSTYCSPVVALAVPEMRTTSPMAIRLA
jgi:hypothetical protein